MSYDSIQKLRFELKGAADADEVFNYLGDLAVEYTKLVDAGAVSTFVSKKAKAYTAAVTSLKADIAAYNTILKGKTGVADVTNVASKDDYFKYLTATQRNDLLYDFARRRAKQLDQEINSLFPDEIADYVPKNDKVASLAKKAAVKSLSLPPAEEQVSKRKVTRRRKAK